MVISTMVGHVQRWTWPWLTMTWLIILSLFEHMVNLEMGSISLTWCSQDHHHDIHDWPSWPQSTMVDIHKHGWKYLTIVMQSTNYMVTHGRVIPCFILFVYHGHGWLGCQTMDMVDMIAIPFSWLTWLWYYGHRYHGSACWTKVSILFDILGMTILGNAWHCCVYWPYFPCL